ncbi:MAG: carbohydrate binding domain-containing protein [Phycisphaerae bacterium]
MIRLNRFRASWLLLAALLWLLPPAPGMAADPGERLWDKNLVYNSSFEEGEDRPTGWTQRRAFSFGQTIVPAQMSIDREVSRTGKQSFHISSPDGTTAWHSMESKPVPVEPGKHYKVAGWIKTENVHAVGSQPLHCNLHIRFTNAKGASVAVGGSRVVWTRTIYGTKDWTAVERIVTAPEGAVEARAGCVLTCSGKAWFDDVTLHAQVPIPWNKKETERITFLYEGAGAPTEEKVASTPR